MQPQVRPLTLAHGRNILAEDRELSSRRDIESTDEIQEGGLAAAAGPDNGQQIAPANLQGHSGQGVDFDLAGIIHLGYIFCLD